MFGGYGTCVHAEIASDCNSSLTDTRIVRNTHTHTHQMTCLIRNLCGSTPRVGNAGFCKNLSDSRSGEVNRTNYRGQREPSIFGSADVCRFSPSPGDYSIMSGGPTGGHLKGEHLKMGFRTEIRTRHVDLALKFAQSLYKSIPTVLSEAAPQRKHRLDRESAV